MFEIREWVAEKKRTVRNGFKSLDQAYDAWKELREKEPKKVFSIYRTKKEVGGIKNENRTQKA